MALDLRKARGQMMGSTGVAPVLEGRMRDLKGWMGFTPHLLRHCIVLEGCADGFA